MSSGFRSFWSSEEQQPTVRPILMQWTSAVALVLALVASPCAAQNTPSIILATTTSTQDSGLLDVLVPRFEQESGIEVKVIAVGTGAALRMGATGDADVLLVHAPEDERQFVASGDLVDGRRVMHNDFIIVGPPADPAGIGRVRPLQEVMKAIASRGTFISRGDDSGTHKAELALWKLAKIDPRSVVRREETGQGMGATLNIANQKGAYTLTDRGTFLAQRRRLELAVVFEGDPVMQNVYHAYAVNSRRHPRARQPEARRFIEFLVSRPIQDMIATFRRDEFGQSLFIPDAVSTAAPARPRPAGR